MTGSGAGSGAFYPITAPIAFERSGHFRPVSAIEPERRREPQDVRERGGASGAVRKLEELVGEYGHVIRGAVRKAGGRRLGAHAEDVEQSVLLEIWKQVRRRQEIRFPSSYLYRAAVRETVRLMKRMHNRREEALTNDQESRPEGQAPNRHAAAFEVRQAIGSGLDGLLPERRKAVEAHLAGYSVHEIMRRFDWPYGKARNLIARGMADLRHRLRSLGLAR